MSQPAAAPQKNGQATSERILTDEMVAAIKAYFPRYPTRQAVTLPAAHIVNEKLRHVPLQAVVEIAELLELHPSQVQDTLTFYGMFKQDQPHGLTRAWVCRSMSCMLLGANDLLEHICHQAGVEPGGTTPDGATTIEYAECLGACEYAPCILANKTLHKCVSQAEADQLLNEWKTKPAK
ncbi:MAG TPA: NAD(P)H-dependent oxidoreductase subunit E [Pirellulaceae bacterium]|nr:NAD(P)H-dependent oxidoreductase subunit E [Pirellulaceae bacterium]